MLESRGFHLRRCPMLGLSAGVSVHTRVSGRERARCIIACPPAPDIQGLPIRSGRAQDQRSVILVTPICRLLLGFPRAPVNHGVFISLPDLCLGIVLPTYFPQLCHGESTTTNAV